MVEILVLAEEDINDLLGMKDAIDAVEGAFVEYSSGATLMPHKLHLDIPKSSGFMRIMPAAIPKIGYAGVKLYLDPSYERVNTPACFLLFEINSGLPVAFLAANRLSQIRTGAASAVASKYLAKRDAHSTGVIGSGNHARTQLEGTCAVRNIEIAYVYSLTLEHRKAFAKEMSEKLEILVIAVDSPHNCAISSEVISLATTTKTPVLFRGDVSAGAHINTIGSSFPGRSEVDDSLLLDSKVVVDCMPQAIGGIEGSELSGLISRGQMSSSDIHAEIGEIILGSKKGRMGDAEVTLFKNTGMAIWDVACATRVYERAKKMGAGRYARI